MTNVTPAVPLSTRLHIRVRNSLGAPVPNAIVEIYNLRLDVTDKDGTVTYTIEDGLFEERISQTEEGLVYLKIRKAHHGPRQANGQLPTNPGPLELELRVRRCLSFVEGGTHVVWDNARRAFVLSVELVDMVHVREFADSNVPINPKTHEEFVANDLLPADAQKMMLIYAHRGLVVLTQGTSPGRFFGSTTHEVKDPTDFYGACTDKCKLDELPPLSARYNVVDETICGIRYMYISAWSRSTTRTFPGLDGLLSVPTGFTCSRGSVNYLDPRNIVGLVRLHTELKKLEPRMTVIYHIGFDARSPGPIGNNPLKVRNDNHGEGRGSDFGGYSIRAPSERAQTISFMENFEDVLVITHWGGILAYEPTSATLVDGIYPESDGSWRRSESGPKPKRNGPLVFRLRGTIPDLPTDITPMDALLVPAPKGRDETPEQKATREQENAVRRPKWESLNQRWHEQMQRAKEVFELVYMVAEREFHGCPAPAIGERSQRIGIDTHMTIHPDYPNACSPIEDPETKKITGYRKDGREAHQNHIHFNIGLAGTTGPHNEFGVKEEAERQAGLARLQKT